MSRIFHPLLAMLACCTRQELARQVAYLREENRILRGRLPPRMPTSIADRRRLVRAGRRIGPQLRNLISICTYETFVRWIREFEGPGSIPKVTRRPSGRPRTEQEIQDLVIRIRKETDFGYTRILGELRKLGIKLSRQTVKNILVEAGLDPQPHRSDDSWDAFLRRHAATLWQCDFVTKPMWTPKGLVDLYFMVFLHLGTRRCWISQCTDEPTAVWVEQQGRNFLMHAEDIDLKPQMVMRDNDAKFKCDFDHVIESSGAKIKRNTYRSPNLRAHVERFIQTLKHECLDKFVIVARRHLNYINSEFQVHYNRERPHEARGNLPPDPFDIPDDLRIEPLDVVCHSRLGGQLKSYSRRAA
ncbi:Integrase core domain protein [Caulifigura coniformis]|uniref:Integrase core domain protein n=1 Tax=Caulifigura coniformis TaxID=2527983 RepID=A0A517SIG1_9PLAN|nr:integrase core domain-containing protein [Caulifigura coniformis]QDT55914.1 Integrase core domain protein [Caulifigura coniformis]